MSVILNGCSPVPIETYAEDLPAFEPRVFFNSELDAWGIVRDWRGRVTRRFRVDMLGTVSGDVVTLDEKFWFDDGEESTRKWTLSLLPSGAVVGQANDVIGDARGELVGNAMRMAYTIDLPVGDNQYRVRFDDMLWQIDERVLFNRAEIKKFGLRVGEVTLFMRRR